MVYVFISLGFLILMGIFGYLLFKDKKKPMVFGDVGVYKGKITYRTGEVTGTFKGEVEFEVVSKYDNELKVKVLSIYNLTFNVNTQTSFDNRVKTDFKNNAIIMIPKDGEIDWLSKNDNSLLLTDEDFGVLVKTGEVVVKDRVIKLPNGWDYKKVLDVIVNLIG